MGKQDDHGDEFFGEDVGATAGYKFFGGVEEEEEKPKPKDEDEDDFEELDDEDKDEDDDDDDSDDDEDKDDEEKPKLSKKAQKQLADKLKGIGALRMKAQLADMIEQDPEATIKALADQYGIDIGGRKGKDDDDFKLELKDIPTLAVEKDEEMPAYISRLMKAGMANMLEPIAKLIDHKLGEDSKKAKTPPKPPSGKGVTKAQVKEFFSYLDEEYDDWGLYEEQMVKLYNKHPSYAFDPDGLYETAKALTIKKAKKPTGEKGGEKKRVTTGSRPTGKRKTSKKGQKLSFQEAWDAAKNDVRRKGR